MSLHEYLGSDSKPGVYAKGDKAMKMKSSAFWKIQSVVKENMEFDVLSNIFFLRAMELFDFRGSNSLSLDETMVSYHTKNPEWKGVLRYVPRKSSPVGLLVNILAGSTAHEKPVCIVLMPQLKEGIPERYLRKQCHHFKGTSMTVHSPVPSQLSLTLILGHCITVKLGSLLSGTSWQ